MKKIDHIHAIRAAKRAHITWVSHAHALIMGLPLEKSQVPIHGTDCKFGQWYYGDGQLLHNIPAFKAIEQPHLSLHETYMKIFQLLFGENSEVKPSFLEKLFGKKADIENNPVEKRGEAQRLYGILKKYSEHVVKHLDALENSLERMDDATFRKHSASV